MIKTKKQMLIVIMSFVLIILLGTTTYAFFNYTKTGLDNTLRVGRINFISRQEQTISLTNAFPIDPDEEGIMDDDTKVGTLEIEIEGDTDYSDGVEYLISTTNTNVYTNEGNTVPISIDVTVDGLGTSNDNYFTARNSKNANIYKRLTGDVITGNQMLLVGYIKPNTTPGTAEGVNGSVTIKAYLDENRIAITDTYNPNGVTNNMATTSEWVNGRTVITTAEWRAMKTTGLSFQIKVEANAGIWVDEPFYEVMKRNAVVDNINSDYVNNTTPGIDFSKSSGNTNGKGLYTLSSTVNDAYPVMYYRGDVVNNNVLFANYCWQIVRTTDTGGIKMIYNGFPDTVVNGTETTHNCGGTRSIEGGLLSTISLKTTSGFYFADDYEVASVNGNVVSYKLKAGENGIEFFTITDNNAASNLPTIAANYPYTCRSASADATCTIIYKVMEYTSGTYVHYHSSMTNTFLGYSSYNVPANSLSDVGYMYNQRYEAINQTSTSGAYFGSNIEYGDFDNNGTNEYRLLNNGENTIVSGKDSYHHYSCDITSPNGVCAKIRYYFLDNYYIELENGEDIYDAIYKMTGNGTDEIKARPINQNYNLNVNDSVAKIFLENWFEENLTNVSNNSSTDYRKKIEDTTYCNDRRFKTSSEITGSSLYLSSFENSGWNPNGGNYTYNIAFSYADRWKNDWYSNHKLDLKCYNKTNQFRVDNTFAKLKYPIGLLTGDETVLLGISGSTSPITYLYNSSTYIFDPGLFMGHAALFNISANSSSLSSVNSTFSIRPVISLKEGTGISGGTGLPTDPYIIK